MKKTVTLTVCNVCQDVRREARTYWLRDALTEVRVDLCEEDARPVTELMSTGEPEARSSKRKSHAFMTMEQIEELKRKKRS